jgi:nucleoside-triphosphatase THEP1
LANNNIIIISGKKGQGKTTKVKRIINVLRNIGVRMSGFITTTDDDNRMTYILNDLNSGKSIVFCSLTNYDSSWEKIGKFYLNNSALTFGNNILQSNFTNNKLVIIDEIGSFEMNNKGWHDSLMYQLNTTDNTLLLIIRESLVEDIILKYNLKKVISYNVYESDLKIIDDITKKLQHVTLENNKIN